MPLRHQGLAVSLAALVALTGCAGQADGASPRSSAGSGHTTSGTAASATSSPGHSSAHAASSTTGASHGSGHTLAWMMLHRSGVKDSAMPGYRAVYGNKVVVVGTAATVTLKAYAKLADRAVQRVNHVLPSTLYQPVLVAAPASDAEFQQIAEEPPHGVYETIRSPGHRPFVLIDNNPHGRLYSDEVQQALTHEMVHVWSMQRTGRRQPPWLREGFATVVSLSAQAGLSYAPQAWREFRPGDRLPSAADFRKTPQGAYFLSWSLCDYIAHRWSMKTLMRLHADQLKHGQAHLAGSLRRVLHTDAQHLRDDWARGFQQQAARAQHE